MGSTFRWALLLSSLALSSWAYAEIEPLLGFKMKGTEMLVCSLPVQPKAGVTAPANCVIHDLDRKMKCTYNFNTGVMRCYRMSKAL